VRVARAGSPTSAATSAICGAFDMLANMCEARLHYYRRCFDVTDLNRVAKPCLPADLCRKAKEAHLKSTQLQRCRLPNSQLPRNQLSRCSRKANRRLNAHPKSATAVTPLDTALFDIQTRKK
jgi:hypothetical protein